MRMGFICLFLLLFTLQALTSVVELEAVSSHDQIHHELEVGHADSNTEQHSHTPEHVHLCHHHHGEHTAKILLKPADVAMAISDKNTTFVYSQHYENISQVSLYRPPIA